MSPYTVRPAQDQDLDRLIELLLALQDHIEAANPDLWQMKSEARSNLRGQIASRLRADQGRALVAEHEQDGVVGVIFGRIVSNNRYSPSQAGLIDQVFVRQDHRRAGLGSLLVAQVCRFFASQDIKDISLRYVVGNQQAEDFWTSLGFSPRIVTAGVRRDTLEALLPVPAPIPGKGSE